MKRLLAIVLAAGMMLSLLAGCAQNASGLQERTAGNAVFHDSFSLLSSIHVVAAACAGGCL